MESIHDVEKKLREESQVNELSDFMKKKSKVGKQC